MRDATRNSRMLLESISPSKSKIKKRIGEQINKQNDKSQTESGRELQRVPSEKKVKECFKKMFKVDQEKKKKSKKKRRKKKTNGKNFGFKDRSTFGSDKFQSKFNGKGKSRRHCQRKRHTPSRIASREATRSHGLSKEKPHTVSCGLVNSHTQPSILELL